ncbi:NLRC4 protein, partial [Atractosteus spatula]|nr:NLRC4 protein [Atractosteus spatula]
MGITITHQIADHIYSKSVIDLEEKDEIYCEKTGPKAARKIIDLIQQKGEKACRLFVDCLKDEDVFLFEDLLGRLALPEVPTKQNIDMMAEDLKHLYKSAYFQKFHPLGEDIDIIFDLETTFTDAQFWKKDIWNQRKGTMTLLHFLGEFKNPTVIEGGAGKGKTTLLKRIAALWASGETSVLNKYRLVFFISLSAAEKEIYETVCEQLLRVPYDIDKETFQNSLRFLKEEVLFLLDGYDEFKPEKCPEIEDMIKHSFRFKNTVIVTTRTESVSNVRPIAEIIAEIGDLSEENSKVIIRNILGPELSKDLLQQLENSSTMKELMKTPLFVVIACAIRLGDTSIIPKTQTVLFRTLYDLMISKNQYKISFMTSETVQESINICGDLALQGIFEHCFEFYLRKELHSEQEDVLLKSGLLNKYTAQRMEPVYRFFHKSFQEYIAGRRLHGLLTSAKESDVKMGYQYLNQIDNISDISYKYYNLLMYTCGSSTQAASIVIQHMANVKKHGRLLGTPLETERPHVPSDNDQEQISHNMEELHKLQEVSMESFVNCALNFFAESLSKSELSAEFEFFFQKKKLHISSQSIPTCLSDFFQYLPNCLTALELIELELFGNLHCSEIPNQSKKTYIPEKAVSLFFDWSHSLNSIEVSLNDFQRLSKKDITYLGKICCSAKSLRLLLTRSKGISGKLPDVLKMCEYNLKDLVIEETPLTLTDEQHIVLMKQLKTLYISDLQTERLSGGLLERIQDLQNLEKLNLINIKMAEDDAKQLAEGVKHLQRLQELHLAELEGIGNGLRFIIDAATSRDCCLKKMVLVNCCLTKEAVIILAENLRNANKLETLDLFENQLEEDASGCVDKLIDKLRALPSLQTLMLPWGQNVKDSLSKLLDFLENLPGLQKLGLQSWHLTDKDLELLSSSIQNGHLRDLQHLDLSENCVSSQGWHRFLGALGMLKKLRVMDLSSKEGMQPEPRLINDLGKLIFELSALRRVGLLRWQLDKEYLKCLNKGNVVFGREFQLLVSSDYIEEDETDEDSHL